MRGAFSASTAGSAGRHAGVMSQVLANATASRFEGVEIAEDLVDLAAAWLAGELDEAAFDAAVDQRIADLARPGLRAS